MYIYCSNTTHPVGLEGVWALLLCVKEQHATDRHTVRSDGQQACYCVCNRCSHKLRAATSPLLTTPSAQVTQTTEESKPGALLLLRKGLHKRGSCHLTILNRLIDFRPACIVSRDRSADIICRQTLHFVPTPCQAGQNALVASHLSQGP